LRGGRTGDYDDPSGGCDLILMLPHDLPQAAANAISDHRAPDSLRGHKPGTESAGLCRVEHAQD